MNQKLSFLWHAFGPHLNVRLPPPPDGSARTAVGLSAVVLAGFMACMPCLLLDSILFAEKIFSYPSDYDPDEILLGSPPS